MTRKIWIAAGSIAALAVLMLAIASIGRSIELQRSERRSRAAEKAADAALRRAEELEKHSLEQTAKIEYLTRELRTLNDETRRKDEELKKLDVDVRGARERVSRAKRTGSIPTGVDELCRRLEELGHGCTADR